MTDQDQNYNKNGEISSGNYINIPQNISIQIMPPTRPIQPGLQQIYLPPPNNNIQIVPLPQQIQPGLQPIYFPPSVLPDNNNIQMMPPPPPQPIQPGLQPIYIPPSVLSDNYQYVQKIINDSKNVLDPIERQNLGSQIPLEPIRVPQNNEDKESDNAENEANSSACFAKCCAIICQILLMVTCYGIYLGIDATRR